MPRTSRTVAQRLASQNKSRKRRFQRANEGAAAAGSVAERPPEQVTDDTLPEGRIAPPPPRPATPVAVRRTATAGSGSRASATRRPYAAYEEEYRYVWADLKRIMLISGVLLVLLVVLSLFIR